ncbi:hypothetical protein HYN69_04120 [Gemmobacter aquarius]|uniref:Glycosyl transferase family 25 domain-containing protein n=1 Tax=Paragemmobacter aquarius TaxID=2169400 RepID=A0A2S0UJ07_9RHOB|nr:glycosyltransferase family 25 protein [Gemmobacter aquarius]AWB47803.1 hypothetical protein HYN69_04120 [Gemmobacter aquarius]
MDVFVINLDRSPDRWQDLRRRASAAGFHPIRFRATDGHALPPAEIARLRALQSGRYPALAAAELGCLLSHRALWQAHLTSARDWALILEDDAHFAGLAPLLTDSDWIPADADIVKCEAFPEKARLGPTCETTCATTRAGVTLARLKGRYHGTAGYFLSRRGAAKLLALSQTRIEAVDRLVFDLALRGRDRCRIYQTNPAPVIQDMFLRSAERRGFASTLESERTPKPASRRWQRLRRSLDLRRLAPILCRLTSRDRIKRVRYRADPTETRNT